MRRPRVVYWNNIPSPYHVERLNAVADRGAVDLEAWFCARTESDRSWAVDETAFHFRHRYVPGARLGRTWTGGHYLNIPSPLLGRRTPDLLVSLYAEPTFLAGLALARARGVRTVLRYLPTYNAWVRRTRLKEMTKRRLFQRVDGFKTPGPEGLNQLVRYGVDPARVHQVTQSIDVQRFVEGSERWRPHRDEVRAALGAHGVVFIYVGRLWRGKGLDHLLAAYQSLTEAGTADTTLLLVGDGRDEALYRAQAARNTRGRVLFAGFVQQPDLPRLYAASDVFVFPTLGDPNGLVVEEAMVSGLPVIAFDAAGDVRHRVPEGIAGYVVPTGDVRQLEGRMRDLLTDQDMARRMGAAGRQVASLKTHERYARDFERMVEAVLADR